MRAGALRRAATVLGSTLLLAGCVLARPLDEPRLRPEPPSFGLAPPPPPLGAGPEAPALPPVDLAHFVATPLVAGNAARLLIDGPQTQEAMFRAMAEARTSIQLETYILEADDIGERLAALLEAKRAENVEVRLLYDSIGSLATPAAYFERLGASGIATCEFNPVNPLAREADPRLSLNNRDHRKLLIVDGQLAFTGGINISGVYRIGSFRRKHQAPTADAGWRDTHVLVRGPVVAQFQALFEQTWANQHCLPVPTRVATQAGPAPPRAGPMSMRLVTADPGEGRSEYYFALISALEHAQRRAWLTNGYFAPDDRTLQALTEAARRGVDVRLVLSGFSDFWATLYAGRARYTGLLAAGVRIYERRDALLHAKTAVIDGVWSSVGSTNLDWRSFVHNYEADLLVLDPDFAGQMEQLFRRDEAVSAEIVAEQWVKRGLRSRFLEWFAQRWEYLL